MMRPVKYLPLDKEDIVGPFEQVYMNVAVTPEEIENNIHSHVEFTPTNILSILANLTPFLISINHQEICINVKWVSKQWVLLVLHWSIDQTTSCTVYKLVKHQLLKPTCMMTTEWTIS